MRLTCQNSFPRKILGHIVDEIDQAKSFFEKDSLNTLCVRDLFLRAEFGKREFQLIHKSIGSHDGISGLFDVHVEIFVGRRSSAP